MVSERSIQPHASLARRSTQQAHPGAPWAVSG